MTRLQSVLVLTLFTLVVIVFGRLMWEIASPYLLVLSDAAASVPGWVWWTVFGSLWWLPFAFGKRGWMGCCGSQSCDASSSHSEAVSA